MRRDLFAEGDAGVYLTDAALLDGLAQDRLAGIAAEMKAEGWAWVDATPGVTMPTCTRSSVRRGRREPTKREAQRIESWKPARVRSWRSPRYAQEAGDEDKGRRAARKTKPWATSCRRWKMVYRTTARP